MADNELKNALDLLEKEKNIPKDEILDAIQEALLIACRQQIAQRKQVKPDSVSVDNFSVEIDHDTCQFHIIEKKTVVDEVTDPDTQISLPEAHEYDGSYKIGDTVNIEVNSLEFSRIAAKTAKDAIVQKIKEVEKISVFEEFQKKVGTVVTGIVERYVGRNMSINLGRTDAMLMENEQIKGEHYKPTDHIKVLILDVREDKRGPRIRLSRTHPDFIKCLFEEEVSEIRDGIVEIKAVSREAGNRTKIAVYSNDPDVDPVGACVGMNGSRVNAVVSEIGNEKIDIIEWSDQPAQLIENALAPAKVIGVVADSDLKQARVVVPDYQLSLAIGREGQNARLAARLTGFKIDIKSETQAADDPGFMQFADIYGDEDDDEYYDDSEENTEDDSVDIDNTEDDSEDIDNPDEESTDDADDSDNTEEDATDDSED